MPPIPVSLVVLTLNEEINIKDCLASAADLDDRHVLDSGSTDRTCAIAQELGAAVHFNAFRGFGQQRNWAIENIPTRYDWQLHLDADERLTPALVSEIGIIVRAEPKEGGYFVPSKLMFGGKWLRHAGQYPAYQARLLHRGRLGFVDFGHGQREKTDYPLGKLSEPLVHYAFSKGLDDWFGKHAAYARREAEQALSATTSDGSPLRNLFSSDATQRRRALKRLASRLPFRYFCRLFYMTFIRGAILDGRAGLIYAQMMATYEAMIDVHMRLLAKGMRP